MDKADPTSQAEAEIEPLDTSEVDTAERELEAALATRPLTSRPAERFKAFTMLADYPAVFFFTEADLALAGGAYKLANARMKPTRRFFDLIAAVRAGNLDRYVVEADD